MQSEGELSIASTGKDGTTGRLVTHTYRVRGPVAIFLTTTAVDVDKELLNRCLVLSVDEDREQTRAIHQRQREQETLEGPVAHRTLLFDKHERGPADDLRDQFEATQQNSSTTRRNRPSNESSKDSSSPTKPNAGPHNSEHDY